MTLWWQQLLLVAAGGALGAAGRFWLCGALLRQLGNGFPWGALVANTLVVGFGLVWSGARVATGFRFP